MPLLGRARRRISSIPWERYWVERGGSYEADDDGFTVEPGTIHPLLARRNPNLSQLDALDDVRCVLALGDPGLGKSWEIDAYVARLAAGRDAAARAASPPMVLLGFDITEFDTRDQVRDAIFAAPELVAWKSADAGLLYLVLDSLDESLMRLDPLCEYLLDEFTRLPLDRLRLRIACRTAVLPQAFRVGLDVLFSAAVPEVAPPVQDTNVAGGETTPTEPTRDSAVLPDTRGSTRAPRRRALATVELVPLSRRDAREAAERQLGSSEAASAFLGAVDAADAGHFAARPQTLFSLIHRFQTGKSLQVQQAELFRGLIEYACGPEPVRPRGNERRPTRTDGEQRARVAARICAAQLFGNRPTIALNAEDSPDASCLDLRDLTGEEPLGTGTLRVDEQVLAEAVDTALFTGRGPSWMAPHQTFAEYLAARWLVERSVPLAQIRPLLIDPLDPQQNVVPQLRQVTAWLAAMRADVFDQVVRREPEIVLWSDVVQVPVAQRPALVDALLDVAEGNRLDLPERSITDRLSRLEHPGLATQLRRVVTNRRRSLRARDLALDIARACQISTIAKDAAAIALATREPLGLRVEAARLVAAVGSDTDRRQLITLATRAIAEDVGDDLKGAALWACHSLLTPDELFGALTMPKRPNWGGSYMVAFADIERHLGPQHVDAGCAWLLRGVQLSSVTERLVHRVLLLGLDRLDDPRIREAVASFYWAHSSRHDAILSPHDEDTSGLRSALRRDFHKRRALLAAIVEATPPGNHGLYWLDRDMPDTALPADIPWMIDQLAALPAGAAARAGWKDLLSHRLDLSSREHLTAALAHRRDLDVIEITGRLVAECSTVDEALEAVRHAREEQERRLAASERRARVPMRGLPVHGPLQSLEARLAAAVAAETPGGSLWARAIVELCRAADGEEAYGQPSVAQIQGLSDPGLIATLADAAERYLADAEVPEDPFPHGQVKWSVIFGFFAGALLYEHAPERLWDLDDAIWARWTRSFAGYAAASAEEDIQHALLEVSLVMAPAATIAELQRALERYAVSGSRWLPSGLFDTATQVDSIAEALGERLAAGAYPSDREFELLGRLLDARPEIGFRSARVILRTRARRGTDATNERHISTLANLLLHTPQLAWRLLRRLAWVNDNIAREVLLRSAASHEYPKAAIAQLTDDQVADLYVLVDRLFPYETDIWHTGAYSPSARDTIENWRRALPHALESRKRDSAVKALMRAAEADPSRDYRVRFWLRAAATLRSDRWRGIHPRELMPLAATPQLRMVESGTQLLDLIAESLARLQQELHGQWRSVVGLWDEKSTSKWVPKQEAHLANALARHLQRDLADRGVVIGRELVIQVGLAGAARGLRTDIDVTATAIDSARRSLHQVRVVSEVKGSWHPEVLTALRGQLVDQYMTPHEIRHGLYLVGDYTCVSWADSAKKRRSARLGGPAALTKVLEAQAAAVTNEMREVRAIVLDVSLPAGPQSRTLGRKRRRGT